MSAPDPIEVTATRLLLAAAKEMSSAQLYANYDLADQMWKKASYNQNWARRRAAALTEIIMREEAMKLNFERQGL